MLHPALSIHGVLSGRKGGVKVLGIGGSPRRGGNSDLLLDKALEGAKSAGGAVDKVVLNDLNFRPCQECGGCDETGACVIEDDMKVVYEKLSKSDALIIASPIFFGSVSAQAKMMIDRFQCLWIAKYILKKSDISKKRRRGIFLAVAGSHRKEFFENAKKIISIFFKTLDIEYAGELFAAGVDKKDAIKEASLKKAYDLGASLVKNYAV